MAWVFALVWNLVAVPSIFSTCPARWHARIIWWPRSWLFCGGGSGLAGVGCACHAGCAALWRRAAGARPVSPAPLAGILVRPWRCRSPTSRGGVLPSRSAASTTTARVRRATTIPAPAKAWCGRPRAWRRSSPMPMASSWACALMCRTVCRRPSPQTAPTTPGGWRCKAPSPV